jgi:hypothetical protein
MVRPNEIEIESADLFTAVPFRFTTIGVALELDTIPISECAARTEWVAGPNNLRIAAKAALIRVKWPARYKTWRSIDSRA